MTDILRINVRVKPRSSKNEIVSWEPELRRLTIRVQAPPVNNAANEAVVNLISKTIRVPKSKIRISIGSKSRDKFVDIDADESVLKSLRPN